MKQKEHYCKDMKTCISYYVISTQIIVKGAKSGIFAEISHWSKNKPSFLWYCHRMSISSYFELLLKKKHLHIVLYFNWTQEKLQQFFLYLFPLIHSLCVERVCCKIYQSFKKISINLIPRINSLKMIYKSLTAFSMNILRFHK